MKPNAASHRLIAFSRIASNTGARSPGEELMTCNTSAVAVCCAKASSRSAVRSASSRRRSAMTRPASIVVSLAITERRQRRLFHSVHDLDEGCAGAFLVELAARRAADTDPTGDIAARHDPWHAYPPHLSLLVAASIGQQQGPRKSSLP